jgi:hypothetical protein
MKKNVLLTIAFCFAILLIHQNSTAQDFKKGFRYYAGISVLPSIGSSGFRNVVISDYIRYPNAEGRAALMLGDKAPSGITFGIVAGADYLLSEKLSGLVEGHFSFGKNVFGVDILVGGTYNFITKGKISLGVTPKIGYSLRQISLGAVTEIRGTPPVVGAGGSFNVGDVLATNVSGFAYGLGFTGVYQVSEKIGVRFNLGYQGASLGKPKLQVTPKGGGTSFDLDLQSPDIVEMSNRNAANIDPKVKLNGLSLSVGAVLSF